MKLYLIRHLPTEWNEKGLLQGKKDISIIKNIKEKDKLRIKENLEVISRVIFDKVLVSSLKRTHQTAELYGYKNYCIEPLIDELNFGKYEGKPKQLMLNETGSEWYEQVTKITLGESLKNFEKRIIQFIEKYSSYNNILIFTHGAVIRALIAYHNYGSIDKMNQIVIDNNSLTILDKWMF